MVVVIIISVVLLNNILIINRGLSSTISHSSPFLNLRPTYILSFASSWFGPPFPSFISNNFVTIALDDLEERPRFLESWIVRLYSIYAKHLFMDKKTLQA